MTDDEFGWWLAGFTDGEGSFGMIPCRSGWHKYYRPTFEIGLRDDDRDILETIQRRLRGGFLQSKPAQNNSRPSARFKVCDLRGCIKLISIFDNHPLQAKKKRDYDLWRAAVILIRDKGNARPSPQLDYLVKELKAVKVYQALPARSENEIDWSDQPGLFGEE